MRLQLLEHDPNDLADTHMTRWAENKGHAVAQTYVCSNEKLPDPDDFDWLMVMGGSPSAWEEDKHPWLAPEKELIARALGQNKIILGICFGVQLLALALGGTVSPNRHREIGWHEVVLTEQGRGSFLFRGIPKKFTTFHSHADCFTIISGCTRLASSQATSNQAFCVEGKPIVGLQFHPEYTPAMIRDYVHRKGHMLKPGPFVSGPDSLLSQTESMPDKYELMAVLLDNMERKFA